MTDKKDAPAGFFKHRLKRSKFFEFHFFHLKLSKYFFNNCVMFVRVSHYDSFFAVGESGDFILFYFADVYIIDFSLWFYLLHFRGVGVIGDKGTFTGGIIMKVIFSFWEMKSLQNVGVEVLTIDFVRKIIGIKLINLKLRIPTGSIILNRV